MVTLGPARTIGRHHTKDIMTLRNRHKAAAHRLQTTNGPDRAGP